MQYVGIVRKQRLIILIKLARGHCYLNASWGSWLFVVKAFSRPVECMEILCVIAENKQSLCNVVRQSREEHIFTCFNTLLWLHFYSPVTLLNYRMFCQFGLFSDRLFLPSSGNLPKKTQPESEMLFLPSVAPCPTETDCSTVTATLASRWHAWGAEEGLLKLRRLNKQNLTPPRSSDPGSDCCFSFWFGS